MSTQRKFPEKYLLSDIQGFSSLTDTLNHVTVHVSTSMSVSQNSWTDSFLANVLDLLTITPNSISFSFHSGTLCPGGLNDLSLDLSFCIVCFIASSLNSFQNNTMNKHSSKTKNIRRKQTRHLAGIWRHGPPPRPTQGLGVLPPMLRPESQRPNCPPSPLDTKGGR